MEDLDVAVGSPEAGLAVAGPHGERAAAVLDGLLVPAELGVARGAVAEQHGAAGLALVQPLAVGRARLGEPGRLEEVVAALPRRRHRLGAPVHARGLPAARVQLARRLRRRHRLLQP